MKYFPLLFLLLNLFSCTEDQVTADMVIENGKILTVDSSFSAQEAVAVKDRKIIFVGKAS